MTDRWGKRLYIAGAMALLILGAVHSLSLFSSFPQSNDTERQLAVLMANYKFDLMGSMRSTGDLMRGFSIAFMLGVLALGALDLALVRERAALLKRVALVNALWLASMTALSLRYFFAAPTSFLAAALVLFVLACIKLPGENAT